MPNPIQIRPDASYLVTGGLGGVGLEIARWLVSQGARAVALAGRRAPGVAAQRTIAELEQEGASVLVLRGDVGSDTDVERMVEEIDAELPPLAGVIHAAGIVDDGVLSQQTWSRFEGVFGPKVAGAWNLQRATAGHALEFFVLFSAGAALVGAPGQSNYAAANAALDALGAWRRARGLPAVSINWGPWSEVGMAASLDEEHRRRLAEQGFKSLTTEQGLRGLEAALAAGPSQVVVMPMDWNRFARGFTPDGPPSLFRDLVAPVNVSDAAAQSSDSAGIERIAAMPPSLRRSAMLRQVREKAAHVLGQRNPEALPATRPLGDLGMDSLMAVDLRNVLNRTLGLSLSATLLFDYPTLDALTDHLLGTLSGADAETESVKVASNGHHDEAIDVLALTDDEAEALLALELSDR
jgi:acyl carrier protein